jgi:tetratricopeptide (TPR) repeat protein
MKRFLLASALILIGVVTAANAQFFTSATTREAGKRLDQGDLEGAIAILTRAIEKQKDVLEAYQMRANLRLMGGDDAGAISDLTAALVLDPGNAKMYEQRSKLRMFKRDSAGALKDLDLAIANGLKTESVYSERAQIRRDMGDTEGAIADFRTALGIDPYLATAGNGLASTVEHGGDADGAIAILEDFLTRYENRRDGKLPTMKTDPVVSATPVQRDGKEADGKQVVATLSTSTFSADSEEEMEAHSRRTEQLMNLALAYANLGRMYAKKGLNDKALASYAKGLSIRNDDTYLLRLRSETRLQTGDIAGAIDDLKVVANSQQPFEQHSAKGLVLLLQGHDAEAEKEFALHLQLFPPSREWLNQRIEAAKKARAAN